MDKNCGIFNIGPSYRKAIYSLMAHELNFEFYLGDFVENPIEKIDYLTLPGYVKTLKNKFFFSHFYWQVGAIGQLFKPYKNYIITGDPFCLSNWVLLFVGKILKKKIYLWSHGWYGDESMLKKVVKKAFFYLAKNVLLYGDYARNLMIEEGFRSNKLITIYNSLDYDKQILYRNKSYSRNIYVEKFGNNNPVLIYIGRIQKVKKLNLLLEALSYLANDSSCECNLVLIGKDTDDCNLNILMGELGLHDKVWLFGQSFNEEELAELISNADLSVTPGNIGLTVMHSLVYGVPVISHNNFLKQGPEFEAILPNITGDFFNENDVFDLIKVIKKWLIKLKGNRAEIAANCYKLIDEKYNPHFQIDILKNIFSN